MIFLALDTSHKTGSLCLARDLQKIDSVSWENEKSHAEHLTSIVETILKTNKLKLEDIDYFCVNNGPGSFTGLRIAVNAVKTFAYAFSKPIATFNSLDLIAASCDLSNHRLIVAVNAHSSLCYYAEYKNKNGAWHVTNNIKVKKFSDIILELGSPNTLFAGDAFDFYKKDLPANIYVSYPKTYNNIPSAEKLAELSAKNISNPEILKTWENLEPFYIRLSAPEEKRAQSPKS